MRPCPDCGSRRHVPCGRSAEQQASDERDRLAALAEQQRLDALCMACVAHPRAPIVGLVGAGLCLACRAANAAARGAATVARLADEAMGRTERADAETAYNRSVNMWGGDPDRHPFDK